MSQFIILQKFISEIIENLEHLLVFFIEAH